MENQVYVVGRQAIVGAIGQAIVYPGETIAADVLWRNVGAAWVAPRFRVSIRESGFLKTWIEGNWITSPGASPGAMETVIPSRQVPGDWKPDVRIDVRIDVEGVGPVWQGDDIFIVGELFGEVEIITVTPYVEA